MHLYVFVLHFNIFEVHPEYLLVEIVEVVGYCFRPIYPPFMSLETPDEYM